VTESDFVAESISGNKGREKQEKARNREKAQIVEIFDILVF
jgi:hypothetical protein